MTHEKTTEGGGNNFHAIKAHPFSFLNCHPSSLSFPSQILFSYTHSQGGNYWFASSFALLFCAHNAYGKTVAFLEFFVFVSLMISRQLKLAFYWLTSTFPSFSLKIGRYWYCHVKIFAKRIIFGFESLFNRSVDFLSWRKCFAILNILRICWSFTHHSMR